MASSILATVITSSAVASGVAPVPCIFSDDLSESGDNVTKVDSASASASEEVASGKVGHSTKA